MLVWCVVVVLVKLLCSVGLMLNLCIILDLVFCSIILFMFGNLILCGLSILMVSILWWVVIVCSGCI